MSKFYSEPDTRKDQEISSGERKIVIVGSGPVGSFIAVLCCKINFDVIIYEKRDNFTRAINLKIENNFFQEVQNVISQLNVKSEFFLQLNEFLQNQNNRILIKDLEERFSKEAKLLGAKYIIRDVNSFEELKNEYKNSNPIILDCTGKNSKLRMNEFGSDDINLVSTPLTHAMILNFKANVINRNLSLYQVMKHTENIKLAEIVVSKVKDENGFSNVTIPIFISNELALVFDTKYPDINRNPLNPFTTTENVPEMIFFPICCVLGNILVDGSEIDLSSVKVKKIEIGCGYAIQRSKDNLICLGDSAIHLAFFRSLNLGLKHALELFIKLSMLQPNVQSLNGVLEEFKKHYPHLNPVRIYPTNARNVFFIVTKVMWYGCFGYCLTNHKRERLTPVQGIRENQIEEVYKKFNKSISVWSNLLMSFEAQREEDIQLEVQNNRTKNIQFDYLAWFIELNGKSFFIRFSEMARLVNGKIPLQKCEFEFIHKCFKARKNGKYSIINAIKNYLELTGNDEFVQLKMICDIPNFSEEEKISKIQLMSNLMLNDGTIKRRFSSVIKNSMNSQIISVFISNELVQNRNSNQKLLQHDEELDFVFVKPQKKETFDSPIENDLIEF